MKSIELLELVATGVESFHKALNVGMKVAGDRIKMDELLHAVE
jgi:hypothetical protein